MYESQATCIVNGAEGNSPTRTTRETCHFVVPPTTASMNHWSAPGSGTEFKPFLVRNKYRVRKPQSTTTDSEER